MNSSYENRPTVKPPISRRTTLIFDSISHGMTNLEFLALQRSWRILEPKLRSLSADILMEYVKSLIVTIGYLLYALL